MQKIPMTVTSEVKDKSRTAAISSVDVVLKHVLLRGEHEVDTRHIFSEGCAAQFRSRYVFNLLIYIQTEKQLIWQHNERHHGQGPMDGIGGTIKKLFFRMVKSGQIVINSSSEFASFADEICSTVDSLYPPENKVMVEPEEDKYDTAIPDTLQIHKVNRQENEKRFCNELFYLTSDNHPFPTQWYGLACGHKENNCNSNTCRQCLGTYKNGEEWIECPLCNKWFHENCFYL